MKHLKDHDFTLHYYPQKANLVADALSRKPHGIIAFMMMQKWMMFEISAEFDLRSSEKRHNEYLCNVVIQPSLMSKILKARKKDTELQKLIMKRITQEMKDWEIKSDRGFYFRGTICIPNMLELNKDFFSEAHHSRYTINPIGTKMYKDLKKNYWWEGMK